MLTSSPWVSKNPLTSPASTQGLGGENVSEPSATMTGWLPFRRIRSKDVFHAPEQNSKKQKVM